MGYEDDAKSKIEKRIKNSIVIFQKAEDFFENGDYKNAAEMFRKVADPLDPETQYNWGVMFYQGIDGRTDYKRALSYFEKAAQQDYSSAEKVLAGLYFNGLDGDNPDYEKSFYYAQKASDHNELDGDVLLGIQYYNGYFVDKDWKKAYEHFNKASSTHSRWKKCENVFVAHYRAGRMCYFGEGIDIDYSKAREHFHAIECSNNNNISQYSDAMQLLGVLYIKGLGGACDTLKAYNCFLKSENAEENAESEYWLGILLLLSDKPDQKQAGLDWLKKAADHKNLTAAHYYENEEELSHLLEEFKTKLGGLELKENPLSEDAQMYNFSSYFPDKCINHKYEFMVPKNTLYITDIKEGRINFFDSELHRLMGELKQYETISINSYFTRSVMRCTNELMRSGKYQSSYITCLKEHFLESVAELKQKFSKTRYNSVFQKRIKEVLLNKNGKEALNDIKSLIEHIVSDYIYLLEFFYDVELMYWDDQTEEIHEQLKIFVLKVIENWKRQVLMPLYNQLNQILDDPKEYVNFALIGEDEIELLKEIEEKLNKMRYLHFARRLPANLIIAPDFVMLYSNGSEKRSYYRYKSIPHVQFDDLLNVVEGTLGNIPNCISIDVTELAKRKIKVKDNDYEAQISYIQNLVDQAKGLILLRKESAIVKTEKPVFIVDIQDDKEESYGRAYFRQIINYTTITEGNYSYMLPAIRQGIEEFTQHIDEYDRGRLEHEPKEYRESRYSNGKRRVPRLVLEQNVIK